MKKHDKLSPLRLREAFATLVTVQPFYTSTQLAATFTHAQCIQAELLSAAFGAPPLPPPTHPPTPLATAAYYGSTRYLLWLYLLWQARPWPRRVPTTRVPSAWR